MREVITTYLAARCLGVLEAADGPATAAELAGKLALTGRRESQRRRVRAIVRELRNRGHWIVATLAGGYWLTKDEAMWKDYNECRQIDAKRIIGEAYRRKQAAGPGGQGLLFGAPVNAGAV